MAETDFAVTQEYQAKVLAYMLQNPDFCDVAKTSIKPEHFNNKALQWFFTTLAEAKHHLTPVLLKEELLQASKDKALKVEELPKFMSIYAIVKERVTPSEESYIKDKVGEFIRTQAVKKAVADSIEMAKSGDWEEIVGMFQDAVQSGVEIEDQGYDYFGSVEERVEDRANETTVRRIPSGIPDFDAMTYGGIKNSQMGMVVGGTGRGKSIFLQWLARTAILMGKKVVYFSFELSKEDIAARFDSMFAKVRPQELNDYQAQVIEAVTDLRSTYGKSLIIKHFPAGSANVYKLKAFCQTLSHAGVVPDLILVDYLDLMDSHRKYGDVHQEIDAITMGLVGMAQELDCSLFTATQLNRAGMVSETPDEAGMAGYVGKQYHADMVLWLAQTREEREDELMRLWVSKNRNGKLGTIQLSTDYSYMTFYHEIQKQEDDGNRSTEDEETEQSPAPERSTSDLSLLLKKSEQEKSGNSES